MIPVYHPFYSCYRPICIWPDQSFLVVAYMSLFKGVLQLYVSCTLRQALKPFLVLIWGTFSNSSKLKGPSLMLIALLSCNTTCMSPSEACPHYSSYHLNAYLSHRKLLLIIYIILYYWCYYECWKLSHFCIQMMSTQGLVSSPVEGLQKFDKWDFSR